MVSKTVACKGAITPQGEGKGKNRISFCSGKCRRKKGRKEERKEQVQILLRNGETEISNLGWAAETILV